MTQCIYFVIPRAHAESVVGEPSTIEVQAFAWEYGPDGSVDHLAEHEVTPQNVGAVLDSGPLYFESESGVWEPITGWRSALAPRLLEGGTQ